MRIGPFDTFLAGAFLFLSGLSLTVLLTGGPWESRDWFWLVAFVALLLAGARRLQQLYRAQRESLGDRPAA
jgi:hypothetical protein